MRHPHRTIVSGLAVTALIHVSGAAAARFNFINRCPFLVNMWDNSVFTEILPRTGVVSLDAVGHGLMWRHGYDPEATLAEVTVDRGRVWYDISVIPPGTGNCTSYGDCHAVANGRRGFNVALAMVPKSNLDNRNCRALICLTDHCDDAFLYPYDNLKVHSCPDTTTFDIIFCPGGIVDLAVPRTTHPPMPRGGANANANANTTTTNNNANIDFGDTSSYIPARFEYRGAQAGNVPGSYNRVTDLATCARQRVDVVNPVGPLSEEVTLVFRGPMEIYNIAVYAAAPDAWPRLSWYSRDGGGLSDNLLFFNNKNIDYSGLHRWGPQTFASWDGNGTSSVPTKFSGTLGEASDVSQIGGGPGIDTGVEVNILTAQRCGNSDCRGFSGGDFSYRGWGGDRKIFVTRVRMPMSGARPNLPAIWMLNAQVMYVGQYSPCNCRGMGSAGGCGELDIVEVIENQNPLRDRVSTHHYFYDGAVPNPLRGDNYATRPTTRAATYVTIIDATVGDGLIKILEIEDDDGFDFAATQLTDAQVDKWIRA